MLIIRFQRVGKKKQAVFRIVLAEKQRAVKKQVQENLGFYNPRSKDFSVPKPERLQYWLAQHVEVSPTVHNLLVTKGLLQGEKVKAWKPKRKSSEALAKDGKKKEEAKAAAAPGAAAAPAAQPEEKAAEEKPAVAESKPEEAKKQEPEEKK